ncbi:MAG: glycoside hydrolase family 3 C-terminal domain-containing protein, partial [Lawsonella sp.]
MSSSSKKMTRTLTALGVAVAVALSPALSGAAANAAPPRPWMNTALTDAQRAGKLLKAMNFSQKVHMLSGKKPLTDHTPAIGYIPPIPELGIPEMVQSDGPAGLRNGKDPATKFPSPIAYAASWDLGIAHLQGKLLGEESLALGTDVLLGPGFNMARNPRGGRTFEYYGEDPFLSGTIAAANVRGIQSKSVIATLKHYTANNQETFRNINSSEVPLRALNEIYLKPFEIAVKGSQPGAVMCSYNAINGVHGCSNAYTLITKLRKAWGFDGFVMTDYPASWSPTDIKNGLNIEMPLTFMTSEASIKLAIKQGKMSEKDVDARVFETLHMMFRFGMFDRPKTITPINVQRGNTVAQKIAEQGAVLLKNDNKMLPLNDKKHRKIAISGDAATGSIAGLGSSNVKATESDTPLDEIKKRSKGAKVTYNRTIDVSNAVKNAKDADVAIVYVSGVSAEAFDRPSINLTAGDNKLVEAVAEANKNTVVVAHTGGPITMPWINKVAAVLNMWQPGQAGGKATARLLSGDANPSGHLPQTFPLYDGQWPANTMEQFPGKYLGMRPTYTEGIYIGYRWYQKENVKPLFPFGYGLSYTNFKYSAPKLLTTSGGKNSK